MGKEYGYNNLNGELSDSRKQKQYRYVGSC